MSGEKARKYYEAMANKDIEAMKPFLHEEVTFKGPFAELEGKAAVVKSAHELMNHFDTLELRGVVGDETQAMLTMNLHCPEPVGLFRCASWVTFENGLIKRVELFYDTKTFESKKDEIFAQ